MATKPKASDPAGQAREWAADATRSILGKITEAVDRDEVERWVVALHTVVGETADELGARHDRLFGEAWRCAAEEEISKRLADFERHAVRAHGARR